MEVKPEHRFFFLMKPGKSRIIPYDNPLQMGLSETKLWNIWDNPIFMDGIIHTISDYRIINGIVPCLYMGYTPDYETIFFTIRLEDDPANSSGKSCLIKQWRFRSRKSIEVDARFP